MKKFNIIKIEWQQIHLKLTSEYDVQTSVAQLLIFFHNHPMVFKKKRIYHSYDILGARMLWKPKEARILTNFIDQPV